MKILTVLLFVLVVWRMIWPLKCRWYIKGILTAVCFLGAFKFQWFRLVGGHYFAPDLPEWIIITGAWLYGSFYFIPPLLLCSEIVRLFKWKKQQKIWNLVNLVIAAAAGVLCAVALYLGACDPRIKHYEVELADLPAEADGMKIVFLTDLHIDHTFSPEKIGNLVARVNALKADFIALGGDLMDGPVEKCGTLLRELDKLKAPMGVAGVLGNHEFYSGGTEWIEFFRKSGIRLLVNEYIVLPNDVVIAGVGDKAAEKFFKNSPLALKYGCDTAAATEGIAEDQCVVLLAHRPAVALKSSQGRFDLQLSGHTHGGMIIIFDQLVKLFNSGWVSGSYQVGTMKLLVSNGTWLWRGFPLRLGRPGEILLVTLKRPGAAIKI